MQCNRRCNLTALWQISIELQPVWDRSVNPVTMFLSLVVCGMCKDEVDIKDFNEIITKTKFGITHGHPDMLEESLNFIDISDGYWIDTESGERTKYDS